MGKSVADLVENGLDDMGHKILTMYGRKPPEYAVFRTDQRVIIQYADDPGLAGSQRKAMAPLNPLRAEIAGWIDGWRRGSVARQDDAARYDLRVGGALVLGFEGDTAAAQGLLAGVRQDILAERVAVAQLQYVAYALAMVSVVVLSAYLICHHFTKDDARLLQDLWNPLPLWRGAAAGAVGAFFSIAVALHGRTVLPDLQWLANALDAVLRVTIGTIAGAVLVGLMASHAVTVSVGGANPESWLSVLAAGFAAGFSERLVQDLLGKVEVKVKPLPEPSVTGGGPAGGGGGSGGARTNVAPPPAGGGAGAAADPHAHEADVDNCLEGVTLDPAEVTPDHQLPPATGGVAKPE